MIGTLESSQIFIVNWQESQYDQNMKMDGYAINI